MTAGALLIFEFNPFSSVYLSDGILLVETWHLIDFDESYLGYISSFSSISTETLWFAL